MELLRALVDQGIGVMFDFSAAVLAVQGVQAAFTLLKQRGISNAVFDITLMRGFDYYTDIVFEIFDKSPENSRSLFGGGRYDGLVVCSASSRCRPSALVWAMSQFAIFWKRMVCCPSLCRLPMCI